MRMQILGAALAMGLLSVGCGGPVTEPRPEGALTSQEQAVTTGCTAAETSYGEWDCEKICGRNMGNIFRYYCYNPSTGETRQGNTGAQNCAACY